MKTETTIPQVGDEIIVETPASGRQHVGALGVIVRISQPKRAGMHAFKVELESGALLWLLRHEFHHVCPEAADIVKPPVTRLKLSGNMMTIPFNRETGESEMLEGGAE